MKTKVYTFVFGSRMFSEFAVLRERLLFIHFRLFVRKESTKLVFNPQQDANLGHVTKKPEKNLCITLVLYIHGVYMSVPTVNRPVLACGNVEDAKTTRD